MSSPAVETDALSRFVLGHAFRRTICSVYQWRLEAPTLHREPATKTMYDTILVTLDGTPSDRAIIEHIKQLAKMAHSHLVLLHVADGWAARTYGPDAVSPEISEDTTYLEKITEEFQSAGIPT